MHRSPLLLVRVGWRLATHIALACVAPGIYPSLRQPTQRRFMGWWSRALLNLLNVTHVCSGRPALNNASA